MVPLTGKTSLGMEYFCSEGDALWNMDDAQFVSLATRELAQLGFAPESAVIDSLVMRQAKAYPLYDTQYERHLKMLRAYIEDLQNLQTVGRNGLHRYNNMDHAMHTGILAARNILGASHCLWSVNEEKRYLEAEIVQPSACCRKHAGADPMVCPPVG